MFRVIYIKDANLFMNQKHRIPIPNTSNINTATVRRASL
jgi:hypothetical protein